MRRFAIVKERLALQPMESLFLWYLSISQVYYGYRYIFQYGDEGTSGTYSDTPFSFQVAKYVMTAILFGISFAILAAYNRTNVILMKNTRTFLFALGCFVAYSLIIDLTMIGTDSSAGDLTFIKAFFFFPVLALVPFHFQGQKSIKHYSRIAIIFGMAYHIAYSVIQLAFYILFSRLPALAYLGALVRFGGGWDDPNGFGTFLTLPLLMLLSNRFLRGTKRYLGICLILILLALTTSVTGMVGCFCGVVCYSWLKRRILLIFVLVAPPVAAVLASDHLRELALYAYNAKAQSAQQHLEQLGISDFLYNSSLIELLLGNHIAGGVRNESFYLALVQNYGLIGVTWLLVLIALTYANALSKASALKRERDLDGAEAFLIMACFLIGFCAASAVTPSFYVFPINFYFWLAVIMIWLSPATRVKRVSGQKNPVPIPATM